MSAPIGNWLRELRRPAALKLEQGLRGTVCMGPVEKLAAALGVLAVTR